MKKEHKKKKKVKNSDVWRPVSIILAILLIFSIFTAGFGIIKTGSADAELTADEAAQIAVEYLNNNILQPGITASFEAVEDVGSLYNVKLVIGGQPYDSYVTKDGGLLFPSAIDMTDTSVTPPPTPTTTLEYVEVSADDDTVKGDPNAPVTIIEFSDYECPFCTRFWSDTLPQITKEYIDTGKVKHVYRDFPLGFHTSAQKAAEASECAGDQDMYWEMHDKLYKNNNALAVSDLKGYAAELGLDTDAFNTCLDSGKYEDEVKSDMADGEAAGVTGTPGFFINGKKLVGAQPFSAFKQIIDTELGE